MSEFKIKSQHVRSAAQDLNGIAKQMKELGDQIQRIQNGLSFEIAQKERIRQRLRTAQSNTVSHGQKIYNSTSTLQNVVNTYETTENRLAGKSVARAEIIKTTAMAAVGGVISVGVGNGGGSSGGRVVPSITVGGLVSKLLDGTSPLYTYEKTETKDKYGKASKRLDNHEVERKKVSFVSINNEHGELKESDIKATKIWEGSRKDTKSVFHNGDTIGNENGTHVKYNVDALKREISSEAYAGLYYTDPKTGEKKLRLAAGASLGFTMSAFSADAEAQIGNSNFGAYAKGDITVGKAEVKGEGVVGLRDANGNFNPTIHGKLSAEAIALEASAKGGVKIVGTDIGVKGSVNVGIGAHAEVGFKDNKFSMDIGASFGVGASVKLEVDVSGTVKAVTGGIKSAWNTVTGWFK